MVRIISCFPAGQGGWWVTPECGHTIEMNAPYPVGGLFLCAECLNGREPLDNPPREVTCFQPKTPGGHCLSILSCGHLIYDEPSLKLGTIWYCSQCRSEKEIQTYQNAQKKETPEMKAQKTETPKSNYQPMQPTEMVGTVLRFKGNKVVRHLLDNGGLDMNHLASQGFPREDYAQFCQLIGYSVGGFSDLRCSDDATVASAWNAPEGGDPRDTQIAELQGQLKAIRDGLLEPIAKLYEIHPSSLTERD